MTFRYKHFNHISVRLLLASVCLWLGLTWGAESVYGQYYEPQVQAPPPTIPMRPFAGEQMDTILPDGRRDVRPTIPRNFEELMQWEFAQDLNQPSNITTEA